MKRSVTIFFLFLLVFCVELPAQNDDAKLKKKKARAEQLFTRFNYREAALLYEEIAQEVEDQAIYLMVADCRHKTGDLSLAEEWYRKAAEVGELPIEEQYKFAEVLMSNGKYDEAEQWYKAHAQSAPGDDRSQKKLAVLSRIVDYQTKEANYNVQLAEINSPYSDFGVTFYEGGIIFASAREEVARGKRYARTNSAYLDLYQSKYDDNGTLTAPEKLPKNINTRYHEGPAALYDDGEKMIFTRNNPNSKATKKQDGTIRLQLFFAEKKEDGSWGQPELIQLAEEKYSVGHPSVSVDGTLLYFSSDMPGGQGGTDLYRSRFSNGNWNTPENLGAGINTKGNEMFPFIHRDGTLYFTSDGHGGLGGLDIYQTRPGARASVQNLKAPVNSGRDDFAFVLNDSGDFGFFSSNRSGGVGDDDLYQFTISMPEPPEETIAEDTTTMVKVEPEYVYTVQILALLNPKTVRRSFLKDLEGVLKHDGKDGFHRYTYGEYTGLDNALQTLEMIRSRGYDDAFIRKVQRYSELSDGPGRSVEELYLVESTEDPVF